MYSRDKNKIREQSRVREGRDVKKEKTWCVKGKAKERLKKSRREEEEEEVKKEKKKNPPPNEPVA
jgi:hypothetical protein